LIRQAIDDLGDALGRAFPGSHIEVFTEGLRCLGTIAAPDRSLEQINVSVATLTCRCGDFAVPDAVLRGY
jgi:hypothetical protein